MPPVFRRGLGRRDKRKAGADVRHGGKEVVMASAMTEILTRQPLAKRLPATLVGIEWIKRQFGRLAASCHRQPAPCPDYSRRATA